MEAQPHLWSKHTYPTNLPLQITHRTWHLLDIFFLLLWVFIAVSSYRERETTRCAGDVVCGLIVVASLVAEHELWARWLRSCDTQA